MQTITNKILTVSVAEKGAEICSVKNAAGQEMMWQGTAPFWASHASNLFPVCGRLKDQKYTYHGQSYEIKNHGFARAEEFTCVCRKEDSMIFRLTSNEHTRTIYPFDFVLEYEYRLEGNTLICIDRVTNTGKDDMIFAMGAHPGFNVEGDFTRFSIDFGASKPKQRTFSEACLDLDRAFPYALRDGRYLDLKHNLFDNDALFFQDVNGALTLTGPGRKVTVRCPQANFWGVWHNPKTEAPFVCIEPWFGIPGRDGVDEDLETRTYMTRLANGKTYEYRYEMSFE